MFRKSRNLIDDFVGDLVHCKDLFFVLIKTSTFGKKVIFVSFVILVLFSSFQRYSQAGAGAYLAKLIPTLLLSFFFFATSERLFYVFKRNMQFKSLVFNRKSIKLCLTELHNNNLKDIVSPEGGLLVLAIEYFSSYKGLNTRLASELLILTYILLIFSPVLLLFCIAIFIQSGFHVLYYQRNINEASNDVFEVIRCVDQMYRDDPEKCADFILDNQSHEVRYFSTIYSVVRNMNKTDP